jgi:tetratricopeptide (TPR) repeat protein
MARSWCWRWVIVATAVGIGCGSALYLARARLFVGVVERGVAAYDRGDWSTAAALADERLKSAPHDRQALRLLARSAVRQGRDPQARALYARLGGASAMEAEDYYLFGTVIDRLGDPETARECWEHGLRAQPNHAEILFTLARLFERMSRFSAAAKLANHLATRAGWEARGNLLLGQIQYDQADPKGAAECWRQALKIDPTLRNAAGTPAQYQKLLAQALLQTGQIAEAVSRLQTILTAGPDTEASWLLSRAYLQTRSVSQAATALEESRGYRQEHPLAPEPAPYVGSARCASCHAAIYKAEQSSLHALTFQRGSDLGALPLPSQPIPDPVQPEVSHTIQRSDGHVELETHERGKIYHALVDYAFGSGDRGLTLVGHDDSGGERELRLSYYADGAAWDVTSGHLSERPTGMNTLGRRLSGDDVRSCLFCHTTAGFAAVDRTRPEAADRGIGCERCHGPGGNHLAAVALEFPDPAIARPGPHAGAPVVALCAQCHSPLVKAVLKNDPIAVRFPGTTLTWSQCYTESGGTFGCLTCHDPHRNAEKSPAFYEAKCLECHANRAAAPSQRAGPPARHRTTVCPVNPKEGCVPCHMPTVKTAIPHSTFTDHHIRIHF